MWTGKGSVRRMQVKLLLLCYFRQVELYGKEMKENLRKIDEANSAPTNPLSALIVLERTSKEAGSSVQV